MAKYERSLKGDFDSLLQMLDKELQVGNIHTFFYDGSDFSIGGVRCSIRVYERDAVVGNLLSANITLIGHGNDLVLSVISSGGSNIKTSKTNFTKRIAKIVEQWEKQN